MIIMLIIMIIIIIMIIMIIMIMMVITWAWPPPGQPRQARQITTPPTPGPIILLTIMVMMMMMVMVMMMIFGNSNNDDDNDDDIGAHLLASLGLLHHHLTQLCSSQSSPSLHLIWKSALLLEMEIYLNFHGKYAFGNMIELSIKICSHFQLKFPQLSNENMLWF